MSEAVEVIISADDQASKEFAKVAANAEKSISQVKTAGSQLKGAAAAGGSLAKMFGGTELGGTIDQIGGLTEKVNQFGEVAKMGSAGASLFTGGLIAMAAVAGYQVGQQLGNLIFQTDKVREEMKRAREESDALQAALLNLKDQVFKEEMGQIRIFADPKQQETEMRAMFERLDRDIQGLTRNAREAQAEADRLSDTFDITDMAGDNAQFYQDEANRLTELANKYRDQQAQIRDAIVERQQQTDAAYSGIIAKLEEEKIALEQGAEAAREHQLRMQGMSDEQISSVMELERSNEAQKKLNDATEKAKQKAEEKKKTLKDLSIETERQRILLTKGVSAAREYELVQKGLTKGEAQAQVAKEEANAAIAKANQLRDAEIQKGVAASEAYASTAASIHKQKIALEEGEEAARKFELVQQGMTDAMAERLAEEEKEVRINQLRKQTNTTLQEQTILLKEGVDAARQYRLEQEGVDKENAKRIVSEEKETRLMQQRKTFQDAMQRQKILATQGEEAARTFDFQQQGFEEAEAKAMAFTEKAMNRMQKMREMAGPIEARESRTLSGRSAAVENMTMKQVQTLVDIHNAILDQTKNNRVRLVQVNK